MNSKHNHLIIIYLSVFAITLRNYVELYFESNFLNFIFDVGTEKYK